MIRNFKYLGRKTIERKRIALGITEDDQGRTASVELDLSNLHLPPNAPVVLEAYRLSTYRRFDLGTVDTLYPRTGLNLDGFNPDDTVLFRVKVLDPDSSLPRLLAEADQLRAATAVSGEAGRTTILHTTVIDLGDEVWRLEVHDDFPMLYLNSRIPGIKQRARLGDDFVPLVFPEVVRLLLQEAAHRSDTDDDSSNWPTLWVRWGEEAVGEPLPAASDEHTDWIESAVSVFCKRVSAVPRYRRASA